MLNKHLEKAKKLLNTKFYCKFRNENALDISLDKKSLPFLFLVVQDDDLILMSFSVDFNEASVAAQIALELNAITSTGIAESFYMSRDGQLLWDAEAYAEFMKDMDVVKESPLLNMEAISSNKH